jgi:hypothetical protein
MWHFLLVSHVDTKNSNDVECAGLDRFDGAEMARQSPMQELEMARIADALRTICFTLLGMVVAATPLALWIAWTHAVFFAVLLIGAAAAALYCFFADVANLRPMPPHAFPDTVRKATIADKVVRDVQRLQPFVHHHRPAGGPKFSAMVAQLKRYLFSTPD